MAPPTKYTLTIFSDDEHKKVLFKKEYTNKKDLCEHFNLNAYAVQNFFKSKPQKVSLKKQKELKRVEIRMETKKKKSDPLPIIKVYNNKGNGKTIIIENEWVPPIDTCWVCADKFACEGYVMGYPICDDCYPAWKVGVECSLERIKKEKQAKQIEEEENKITGIDLCSNTELEKEALKHPGEVILYVCETCDNEWKPCERAWHFIKGAYHCDLCVKKKEEEKKDIKDNEIVIITEKDDNGAKNNSA